MSMWVAEQGSDRLALRRISGFALPGLIAASSLGILVLDNWYHVGSLAIILAAITLALAGVRLAFRPALRIARAQLRSSEERYRLLFEQNPLPMVTYDRQTLQIVAASNAMVAGYGYSLDELHAMTTTELQAPEDVASPLADLVTNPSGQGTGPAHKPARLAAINARTERSSTSRSRATT